MYIYMYMVHCRYLYMYMYIHVHCILCAHSMCCIPEFDDIETIGEDDIYKRREQRREIVKTTQLVQDRNIKCYESN